MNQHWLDYQQQIALLLAPVPRYEPATSTDWQRSRPQAMLAVGHMFVLPGRHAPRLSVPGIRRSRR